MNADELANFMTNRASSPNVARTDAAALACYGCAHSSAIDPPPGRPSGERPCQACVRNPDREPDDVARRQGAPPPIVVDDRGNARCFDAFAGTQYNGVPIVYHPSDRYVTLDHRAQEDWLDAHPEYKGSVSFSASGKPIVIDPHA